MSKNLLNLLLLVASVAMYLMVIKPLYTGMGGVIQPERSVKDLALLNEQYNEALVQADSIMAQSRSLKSQYERIRPEEKSKISVMVPDKIDKVRLLSEVLGLARDAGFILSDLSYSELGALPGGKSGAVISFSVKTTYPRFKALMKNFEESMRLYSIDTISFSAPEKETDLTSYQVRLQTYYLK